MCFACTARCCLNGLKDIVKAPFHCKHDESDRTTEECSIFIKISLLLITTSVIWVLLYMPSKIGSRSPESRLPEKFHWMVSQRDLNDYILPDNDTRILFPKSQCNDSVFLTVIVCSSVSNFDARQAIRNSWGQYVEKLPNIQLYFLLGKSLDEFLNSLVANESLKYNDIIQQDFIDTYNNLTLKSVMLLKWVNHSCANSKYVMKTDDDMFINLPNLFRLLKAEKRKRLLFGRLIKDATPVKNQNSKWFAPNEIFSERVYPPYLSGTGYVMSGDTVPLLYRTALNTPFFYLEDIFITGICARRLRLTVENNGGFSFFKRANDACVFKSIITAHRMKPKELVQMWNSLQHSTIKCKEKTAQKK